VRYRKGRGDGNSLMQVAAAVVGSAAAAQHIPTEPQHAHTLGSPCPVSGCRWPMPELCCPDHDPDGVEDIQCCDDCPVAVAEEADARARLATEWERVDSAGVTALRASAAAFEVHQALNTYEVAADVPQTYEDVTPHMALVIGANHRKLIARWDTDGLWLGGCLITDRGVAEKLASFITREDEDA